MNITLWILQIILALHTAMGAIWKFSHPEQAVPSLKAIPHGLWLGLSTVELVCCLALIIPALAANLGSLAVCAAAFVAAEMLLFTGVHLASGARDTGPVIYWLVVALFCGFICYGRLVVSPIAKAA